jgi:hypothetical protein
MIEKFMKFSELPQFEEKLQYVKHLADLFEENAQEKSIHIKGVLI